MTAMSHAVIKNVSLVSPQFDFWIRKSPFFDKTVEAGCKRFSVANEAYYPILYSSPLQEYDALVSRVTLWDVPAESPIEITGPDAASFLDWAQTRDIAKLPVGRCWYVIFVNDAGGLIFDSVLLRLAEDRFWLSGSLDWLQALTVGRGFDIQIAQTDVSPLQLQGPRSLDVLRALNVPDIAELSFFRFTRTSIGDSPVIVTRTGWSGELGFELYLLDNDRAGAFWDTIVKAGRPFGLEITASSEMRRVEAGILNAGTDFTPDDNPFEVGLGRLVDVEKPGDFVGRGALEAASERCQKRLLSGIMLNSEPGTAFEAPWAVQHDGVDVGRTTVVVFSPALGRWIGLALVPRELASCGAAVVLSTPAGPVDAVTAPFPFVDADRQRMRP